ELDTDKDGVADSADKCPTTEAGKTVDATGCEPDTDKDGMVDSADKCANTAEGTKVDETGCDAIADADKDGVADDSDLCADTAAGTSVNQVGCAKTENINLQGVNFEKGSDQLTADSLPILDEAAATLKKYPELKIEVDGHTDSSGDNTLNKNLSQKRAEAVKKYLTDKGVTAALTAVGYGEEKPVADNNSNEGRAKNRRVELKIQE
ncbi:MAG TPA: OmpA family protein, partial [Thiolinea sp.]|nr:OmpA family protein [Thiolinea sp.]